MALVSRVLVGDVYIYMYIASSLKLLHKAIALHEGCLLAISQNLLSSLISKAIVWY